MWNGIIVAFVIAAAISDAWKRKMPNVLTTAGLVAGLAFHAIRGGVLSATVATLVAFAVGLTFFHLRAIGGGDVKLITALGAMLGLQGWLLAMQIATLFAAAIALLQAGRQGVIFQTLRNTGNLMYWSFRNVGKPHPQIQVDNILALRAPFGVAVAMGTLIAMALQPWMVHNL